MQFWRGGLRQVGGKIIDRRDGDFIGRRESHFAKQVVQLAFGGIAGGVTLDELFKGFLGAIQLASGDQGVAKLRECVWQTERIAGAAVAVYQPLVRLNAAFPLAASFSEFLVQVESELRFTATDRAQFAIEDAEGIHIGTVMFYHADRDRESAELGIVIGLESHRGRGLGTAATVAFLRFLWQNYPFRRVYLHALEWNAAALASFRKAGFSETARVLRGPDVLIRMEVRREWWLLWDAEGRFPDPPPEPTSEPPAPQTVT